MNLEDSCFSSKKVIITIIIIAFISGSIADNITHTQSIKHNTPVKKKLRNYSNKTFKIEPLQLSNYVIITKNY